MLGGLLLSLLLAAPSLHAQTTDEIPKEILDRAGAQDEGMGTTGLTRSPEDPLVRNQGPPIAGPVDPKIYRVGPGDLIQIQLSGRTSRNWLLAVGPEGYLLIPGVGSTNVAGKTLAEARTDIVKVMQTRYKGVETEVRLGRPRTFQIYLTGQVKTPGVWQAVGSSRVADVLSEGSFADNASHRRIEVNHTDGTREIADLVIFTRTGDQSANPWLRDGDVINVPVAVEWVWAQGAVGRAAQFELGLHDSLLTLFHLAGDPIPAAEVDKALLVRWKDPFTPDSLWLRLDEVYSRQTNPQLRDGDRLYVYYLPQYHVQHEVYLYGEVQRPGVYPITEGRHRLTDLLRAAGGFLPTADLTAIRIHRTNPNAPTEGEKDPELDRLLHLPREQLTSSEYARLITGLASLREDYRVDWTRLNSAPQNLDLLLKNGDVVRVDRLVSSVRVDGAVRRPGILSFKPGLRIRDYIDQAGGMTEKAWASQIRVTRAVTGQTLPANNVPSLDPGDFVWVPERPDKTAWDHISAILIALAQLATVVIAVRSIH
jgi:protein involved in polysaccharide export with SLBB domain